MQKIKNEKKMTLVWIKDYEKLLERLIIVPCIPKTGFSPTYSEYDKNSRNNPPETSPARIKDAAQPLIALYDFTPPAEHNSPGPSIEHYYDSRDRDTQPVRTAVYDPLITFHLSGAMSAIYAWQASLTLLAPDEWAIDRTYHAIRYDVYTGMALARARAYFGPFCPNFCRIKQLKSSQDQILEDISATILWSYILLCGFLQMPKLYVGLNQ